MSDAHLVALHYRFVSRSPLDRFDRAVPLKADLGDFECTLADGVLIARPRAHFSDRESARAALEPLLRSWEQRAFVDTADHRLEFIYERADVVDRAPGGSVNVYPETARASAIAADAVIARDNSAYPAPDPNYIATPLSDWMAERLRRVRDGDAELVATAYNILTRVEQSGSGGGSRRRQSAARAWGIEMDVLDTLGRLSAKRDPARGRKSGTPDEVLSDSELAWLRAAISVLARRSGEIGAGAPTSTITMADLPQL